MNREWNNVILFDGECSVCHFSVQFIIKRDVHKRYKFAPLTSEIGKTILKQYGAPSTLNSLVFVENGRLYFKSTAALKICKHLKGMWKWLSILLIVPKKWRDPVYDFLANNRYKWFGRNNHCFLPTGEDNSRFLDKWTK